MRLASDRGTLCVMAMEFQDLLSLLPMSGPKLELDGNAQGVRYITEPNGRFVEPKLRERSRVGDASPSALLISARGATGKTTLAEAIAYPSGAALWDLGKKTVARDSFVGAIANAFGAKALPNALERFQRGEFLVLLDALDEARVGSGDSNFDDFLAGMCEFLTTPRPRPSLVLFARPDTAEWLAVWFEVQARVPFAWFQIESFDRSSAVTFLDRHLDWKLGAGGPHRQHRHPFELTRDRLFERIQRLLGNSWADDKVASFLGYAPVLAALAEFLAYSRNYGAAVEQLSSGSKSSGELLNGLIREILRREQQDKFLPQARLQLAGPETAAWRDDEWARLFSPKEQCHTLLSAVLKTRIGWQPQVPESLRNRYDKLASAQLSEHPFRGDQQGFANVVFREYLYATALTESSSPIADAVRAKVLEPAYLPTRLLAEFMGARPEVEIAVDARDVGLFYESLLAGNDDPEAFSLFLFSEEGSEDIVGLIGDVQVRVPSTNVCIRFWRALARALITVQSDAQLGLGVTEFRLGPDVELECGSLTCSAKMLRVLANGGGGQDGGVVIVARNYAGDPPSKIQVYAPAGKQGLSVRWEGMTYPWVQYRLSREDEPEPDRAISGAYKHLSRFLKWFRSHKYGDLARHHELIEKFAVGGTAEGRRLLEFCVRERLILREGTMYRLNAVKVQEIGIHWVELRDRRLGEGVRRFLRKFAIEGQQ